MTNAKPEKEGDKKRVPRFTGWVVILAALTFGAGYLYYLYLEEQKVFADTYYFRTLQEVATEFNSKLDQLVKLHQYGESRSTIQSIFTTYQKLEEDAEPERQQPVHCGSGEGISSGSCSDGEGNGEAKDELPGDSDTEKGSATHTFTLEASRLVIRGGDDGSFFVSIGDLLPEPTNDFVQYVIADTGNHVLSTTGGDSGLSMIDTKVVSRAIQLRENEDWLKLAAKQGAETPKSDQPLPGHSTQIDIALTTGMSRLFVLPFQLRHGINVPGHEESGVPLYLLGLQPETVVDAQDSERWNLSLLVLSLVALVFLWTVSRLLMLSRHQPLGNGFYRITVVASYLTFVLLVALLVAFAHRNSEIAIKQQKAYELIERTEGALTTELREILSALDGYHHFYSALLERAEHPSCAAPGTGYFPFCEPSTFVIETNCMLRREVFDGTVGGFLSVAAGSSEPVTVDQEDLPQFSLVNIYGPCADVTLMPPAGQTSDLDKWQVTEWYNARDNCYLPAGGKLLLVFLMNKNGQQILPTFYYAETNNRPQSYLLAHRDYFRRVRDQAGWNISLDGQEGIAYENFYIQRLLNINTGTRGTTIGMPLRLEGGSEAGDGAAGLVLGADIELPSLSLAEYDDPNSTQDMVVMVIDRITGQILYHMDRDRSMVENLYQAGRGSAGIAQRIKSGRFAPAAGHYHGVPGEFVAAPLPVSQWAMVVFIPDAGSHSLMTNTFLVSVVGMAATLILLACLLIFLRRYRDTNELKLRWGISTSINRHGIMLFASILITGIYFGFWLGEVIDQQTNQETSAWSLALSLLAVVVVTSWGYSVLRRLRRQDRLRAQLEGNAGRGTAVLLAVFLVTGLGITAYLQYIGNRPDGALRWYYSSLHEARLNQEERELREIALTRYPNSIKLHGQAPLSLMPISDRWSCKLSSGCADTPAGAWRPRHGDHVLPEHVGTFSQLTAATGAYDWVKLYMFGIMPDWPKVGSGPKAEQCSSVCPPPDEGKLGDKSGPADATGPADDSRTPDNATIVSPALPRFIVVMTAAYLLLCTLWFLFYRWVIGARLVGAPGLIQHLKHIVERNVPERDYDPLPVLVLDLHCRRHAGNDLSALLQRCEVGTAAEQGAQEEHDPACRGMAMLLQECPWLKSGTDDTDILPGAHISFDFVESGPGHLHAAQQAEAPIAVQISDLDVCLSDAKQRSSLLRLVRHLKAMCLAGELAELRLNLGFHSYEALLLKAHNIESDREPMTAAEFADWAETLMDFTVDLPAELTAELDPDFVVHECGGSSLLQRLPEDLLRHHHLCGADWRQRRRWLLMRDLNKTGAEWATINCILLKAGALFRHKWEACSGAEKLALYFLAKRKRVNTANAQLLEQLALQGLIRVDYGCIRIVNNSFAYFARHAEDTTSLKNLVDIGGIGAWRDYRLPVTLVVLLLLGGIAFTSGSSLYMIAASLLGLLATIGSLTSSAQMIRENLR